MTYLLLFLFDPRKCPSRNPEVVQEFAGDSEGGEVRPTAPLLGSCRRFSGATVLAGKNSESRALEKTVRPGTAEWFGRKFERLIHPRSAVCRVALGARTHCLDRKSTRLNSS